MSVMSQKVVSKIHMYTSPAWRWLMKESLLRLYFSATGKCLIEMGKV